MLLVVTKGLIKGLEALEIKKNRVDAILTTELLWSDRILRRVLETWGHFLSLKSSANSRAKNTRKSKKKIIIIIIIIIIIFKNYFPLNYRNHEIDLFKFTALNSIWLTCYFYERSVWEFKNGDKIKINK